eukprot:scaffold954_cov173-Ochromonas_danica.AAC.21
MLDRACVGENIREVWLTSLTNLRISQAHHRNALYSKVTIFYKWLGSRNVFCVEGFPIRLDIVKDLVRGLEMKSFCATLRSIDIMRWSFDRRSSDAINRRVKKYLPVCLSHCHSLQGVAVWMDGKDNDVVLSVLIEQLRENSLVKISLHDIERPHVMVIDFITKHASSSPLSIT